MNRTIKILLVDHSAVWGGGEVAIFNLCRHLNPRQFCPLVLTAVAGPFVDRLREAGVAVRVIPLHEKVRGRKKDSVGVLTFFNIVLWWHLLRYVVQLVRLIKREQIDIVHTCSLKAHLYGGLAAKLAGKPLVWHILDYIDTPYLPRAAVVAFRILAGLVPCAVVTISASNARTVSAGAARVTVINCGTVVGPGPEPLPPAPPVRVALIGRIAPWKGQMVFLAAAKLLQDEPVEFIVAGAPLFGEEDYRQDLVNYVARNGLANVRFTGFVHDVRELLRGIHIMVHCSISPEPFGQVIIEAMAAGRMVIATRTGGPGEIVVEGYTGLLVEPGRPEELAGAIKKVLANPAMMHQFGIRGYERAREKYEINLMVAQWEALYRKLVNANRRGRCRCAG